MMRQIDNLSSVVREYFGERSRQGRADVNARTTQHESIGTSIMLTLAFGGIGLFLFRALASQP